MDVRELHRERTRSQIAQIRRHVQEPPSVAVICGDEIPLGMPIEELAVRLMPARHYLIINFEKLALSGWIFPGKSAPFSSEYARATEGQGGIGELLRRLNDFHAGMIRISGHAFELADFMFLTGLDGALGSPGVVAQELSGLAEVLPVPVRKVLIVLQRRELAATIDLKDKTDGPR